MIKLEPGMIIEQYTNTVDGSGGQYVLLTGPTYGYILTGRDLDVGEKFPDPTVELDGFTDITLDHVKRVYSANQGVGVIHDLVVHDDRSCVEILWQEPVRLTHAELEDLLGYAVEIID